MNRYVLVVVVGIVASALVLWVRMRLLCRSWKGVVEEVRTSERPGSGGLPRKRHYLRLRMDDGSRRTLRYENLLFTALFPGGLTEGDLVVKEAGCQSPKKLD